MAGWKTNLSLLQLDPRVDKKVVDDRMRELTKEGARVWLEAALSVVPTWSRASRATFEALAQAVGYKVSYGPVRSRSDRRSLGLRTGFGGIERRALGTYAFYYRSDLEYLNFNESNVATVGVAGVFKGLINPTPYNFRQLGNTAFQEFWRRQAPDVLRNVRIQARKIT